MATELLDAGALLVGSPTINNNIFPSVADVLAYVKGLRPCNMLAAAFGSFGWSGEAPKQLQAALAEMNFTMTAEPLRVKYVPDAAALSVCREFGQAVSKQLCEICDD